MMMMLSITEDGTLFTHPLIRTDVYDISMEFILCMNAWRIIYVLYQGHSNGAAAVRMINVEGNIKQILQLNAILKTPIT